MVMRLMTLMTCHGSLQEEAQAGATLWSSMGGEVTLPVTLNPYKAMDPIMEVSQGSCLMYPTSSSTTIGILRSEDAEISCCLFLASALLPLLQQALYTAHHQQLLAPGWLAVSSSTLNDT
jgi:hypothetical protein